MSKITLTPNASGAGTFTIASPNGGTNRTLTLPDSDGTLLTSVAQSDIAAEAVNESKLQVSNAPTNGYALTAQSGNTGGMTWAEVSGLNNVLNTMVTTSQTYTVPTTGTLIIQAAGAGGSGGRVNGSRVASSGAASGGGGGGYSYKKIDVESGDEIVMVIGAGGVSVSGGSADNTDFTLASGNAGGATTVDGSNIGSANATINIDANGGGGGNAAGANSYDVSLVATASVGGTATGGDINRAGGTSSAKTSNPMVNSGALIVGKSASQGTGGGLIASVGSSAAAASAFGENSFAAEGSVPVASARAASWYSYIKLTTNRSKGGGGASMSSPNNATNSATAGEGEYGGGGGGASGMSHDQTAQQREATSGAGGNGFVLLSLFAAI